MNIKNRLLTMLLFIYAVITINGLTVTAAQSYSITDYSGDAYKIIDNNEPAFTQKQKAGNKAFEKYSELDSLGRCGVAFANICEEIMPDEKRGNISSVHPSGWRTGMGWERCHLIGFQLSGENANERNLITGTHYFNVTGMLPFENMVADYVDETGNHVLYRVTPKYKGNEKIARGVQLEAWSVEDSGDGIAFNVFIYNVKPSYVIDYNNGTVKAGVSKKTQKISGGTYSKIYKEAALANSSKIFKIAARAKTNVTYRKISGTSKLSISSGGKVTVKKKTKAGTYTMKVKLTAKETSKYKKNTVTRNVKVTIEKNKSANISEGNQTTEEQTTALKVSEVYVYITDTGSKYHMEGCRYLKYSSHKVTQAFATSSGYTACSVCY